MTPAELLAECDKPGFLGEPRKHIYLTVGRAKAPRGRTIRMAGRHGPAGRICTIKQTSTGFDIVAVFEVAKVRVLAAEALAAQS
jgi:hypothetical protein